MYHLIENCGGQTQKRLRPLTERALVLKGKTCFLSSSWPRRRQFLFPFWWLEPSPESRPGLEEGSDADHGWPGPKSSTGLSMVYSPRMLNMAGVCWRWGCRKNRQPGLVIVIIRETLPKSLVLPVREINMCCVHLPRSGRHMFKHSAPITLIWAKHTFEKVTLLK